MEKPRLCEILGVEVGEEFKIERWGNTCFHVDYYGFVWRELTKEEKEGRPDYYQTFSALCEAIEHPERIIHLPKPLTYTEQEIAIMRGRVAEGLNWIARSCDRSLRTFVDKPQPGKGYWNDVCGCPYKIRNINLFPQITFENSPVDMVKELERMDDVRKEEK